MIRYGRIVYFALMFLFLLTSVSAAVDTVIVQLNSQNYNYAVIGRTYDFFVAGSDLQAINNPELQLISNTGSNLFVYKFTPGNITGIRIFNDGVNSFNLSVLSEVDELADSIGSVVIEVDDTSSSVKINNLNLSNRIIRNLDMSNILELRSLGITRYNLPLDQLLSGLTFDLNFVKNSVHPTYNLLNFQGTAANVLSAILLYNQFNSFSVIDINNVNNHTLLNQVIDKYNANIKYGFNANAVKQGNNFEFSSDEGYASLNGTHLKNLQAIINEKIKFINPDEVIDVLLPIGDFSGFKQFVDFDTSVDFGNLTTMQDGNYALKVLYIDKFGNNGTMPFEVVLEVTNGGNSESANSNGTVNFTNVVISQTLQRIQNLPPGINLTATLYGSNTPSGFLNAPINIQSLNYIKIDSSNSSATNGGGFDLYFKIDKNSIPSSAKNEVRLYVQEGASWSLLPTSLISETLTHYEYKATIPHFSNFLVGYVSSSSGGGSSNDAQIYQFGGNTNTSNEGAPRAINLGNPNNSPEEKPSAGFFSIITGAVIGTFGSPMGIAVIMFIAVIVGLMIVFRNQRKNKKVKGDKLNDRGDKVDEP